MPKMRKGGELLRRDRVTAGNQLSGPHFEAVAMSCPNCGTVLGVTVDPLVMIPEIVARVSGRAQKGRKMPLDSTNARTVLLRRISLGIMKLSMQEVPSSNPL